MIRMIRMMRMIRRMRRKDEGLMKRMKVRINVMVMMFVQPSLTNHRMASSSSSISGNSGSASYQKPG